jgi:ankyrin repeat protein
MIGIMKKHAFFFLILVLTGVFFLFAQEKTFPPNAVLVAAYKGDVQTLKEILATNPDKNVRDSSGRTALHDAMFQKNMEAIRLLLEHGFDVNATSPVNGYTPLHDAVWVNNIDAAKLLLEFGADTAVKDTEGFTPLDKARKTGKREMVLLLSQK